MGRPPIGERAMSDAERQRRRRAKLDTKAVKAAKAARAAEAATAKAAPPSSELNEARKEIERLKAELARERAKKGRNRK